MLQTHRRRQHQPLRPLQLGREGLPFRALTLSQVSRTPRHKGQLTVKFLAMSPDLPPSWAWLTLSSWC